MPSVLIVDDEEQVRHLIRIGLEESGYEVREARSGQEGLALYREKPADLVIMDIVMPGQDGFDSIRTLRQEFPAARVIAMTGESDMIGILNYLDVATMLGACRTFQKPFEVANLIEAVRTELTG
jgi:DNA-binding response OmpR family regulator